MMKIRKLNRRYSKITTLSQLHEERDKLDLQLELRELELKHNYASLKNNLSFSNLLDMVMGRFSTMGTIFNGVVDGFSWVTSFFPKKKKKCKRR